MPKTPRVFRREMKVATVKRMLAGDIGARETENPAYDSLPMEGHIS